MPREPAPAQGGPRWVVTERVQPQGEEGVRWVQLSFAREVGWPTRGEPPSAPPAPAR